VVVGDEQRERWWRRLPPTRTILAVVGVALLLAGFVWLLWLGVPALYSNSPAATPEEIARLNAVTTARAALLAGLVGLGALGTFWLNSRVYRITARTFELTERGHLTERYSKAIEHLGDDKLDVRLGGIYALEQLVADSENPRDQATIVEVLSAFVRVHSDPLYQYKASLTETAAELGEPIEEQRRRADRYVGELNEPPVDVQAAVTVLGRLPPREEVSRGDLTGANLLGVFLEQADLTGALLRRTNLTRAWLFTADLTGAQLVGANLTEAQLIGTELIGANLIEANLTDAKLAAANLTEAWLEEAKLTGAYLEQADLTGADMTRAVGLDQEQVDLAIGSETTVLPEGLRRPESWSRPEGPKPD
jgi:hypothetical protein